MFFLKRFIFGHKDLSTEQVRSIIEDFGEDIEKYGYNRVRERSERETTKNAWLGFFVCLIPIISIALFFIVPALAAAIITVVMIAFILVLIINS